MCEELSEVIANLKKNVSSKLNHIADLRTRGHAAYIQMRLSSGFTLLANSAIAVFCVSRTDKTSDNKVTNPFISGQYCENPCVPTGSVVSTSDPSNFIGSILEFSCSDNYFVNGTVSRTCMKNRKWSSSDVDCLGMKIVKQSRLTIFQGVGLLSLTFVLYISKLSCGSIVIKFSVCQFLQQTVIYVIPLYLKYQKYLLKSVRSVCKQYKFIRN